MSRADTPAVQGGGMGAEEAGQGKRMEEGEMERWGVGGSNFVSSRPNFATAVILIH